MITETALLRLQSWLSPSYPVGAFSYSHGLEWAVEEGMVRDASTLQDWGETVILHGAGRNDAALLVASWQAADRDDSGALAEIAELAVAWRGSAETALENTAQGAAFLATTRAAWPHPVLDELALAGEAVALPVAIGVACAVHGIALQGALAAYLHGFAANLVSAGLRLVPLGQTDGQRIMARLEPVILAVARAAAVTPLDQAGNAAPFIDWCSMRHERQYTRLFRS